jgi:hypothetical protein
MESKAESEPEPLNCPVCNSPIASVPIRCKTCDSIIYHCPNCRGTGQREVYGPGGLPTTGPPIMEECRSCDGKGILDERRLASKD